MQIKANIQDLSESDKSHWAKIEELPLRLERSEKMFFSEQNSFTSFRYVRYVSPSGLEYD